LIYGKERAYYFYWGTWDHCSNWRYQWKVYERCDCH